MACSGAVRIWMALPLGLLESRADLTSEPAVVHLNHQLRGEDSAADESFVRALADREGLPIHVRSGDVAALAAEWGVGLEEAGRRARYGYFAELIGEGVCDAVATGHTLSDQAETVLFQVRAAGCGLLRRGSRNGRRMVIRPLRGVPARN